MTHLVYNSTGMVVLGDPRAMTHLEVSLTGTSISVTSATHFLPIMTTPTNKVKTPSKSFKRGKKSKRLSIKPLPGLRFNLGLSTIDVSLPMYGKNATAEFPQQIQLSGSISDFSVETLSSVILADGIQGMGSSEKTQVSEVVVIPKIFCNYNVVRFGKVDGLSGDTMSAKLKISFAVLKLSFENISKVVFCGGSWMTSEFPALFSGGLPYPLELKYQSPTLPKGNNANFSCLILSFTDTEMGISKNDKYASYTGALGSTQVSVDNGGTDVVAATVLYGPMETMRSGCTETIQDLEEWLSCVSREVPEVPGQGQKMVDVLLVSSVDQGQ